MRNIKTYEIFSGHKITNSLKKDFMKFNKNLYDSSKKTQKSSASVMNLTSKKKYGKKSSFFNYI